MKLDDELDKLGILFNILVALELHKEKKHHDT
jgi:hypothetical protein